MSTARRQALLDELRTVGRDHSDATVLFHHTISRLLGLEGSDGKTMSLLEREGPLSAGEIARRTGLRTASVTNLIDRLEQKGFVRRSRDPRDRRGIIVEPTAEGVAAFTPFFVSTRAGVAQMWARYTDNELAVILDFLKRNAGRLRTEATKLAAKGAGADRSAARGR